MRRGSNSLLLILAIFLILGAGAAAYFYFIGSGSAVVGGAKLPPTPIPDQNVVEAVVDLKRGTVITNTSDMLRMKPLKGALYAQNPKGYFTSLDDLRTQKALEDIQGGKPVLRSQVGPAGLADLIPAPAPGQDARRAFPIQVNTLTGLADLVQPGDYVDIMASFNQNATTMRPGIPVTITQQLQQQTGSKSPISVNGNLFTTESTQEGAVKVLLQDIQVLQILHPAPPPPPGSPTAQAAAPTQVAVQTPQPIQVPQNASGQTLSQGNWVIMVGVTDQEAEVLRFTLDRGIGVSTLLRRSGDHTTQHTVGATLRILVDNFGMPVGSTLPSVQHPGPNQLPDVPTLPREDLGKFAPTLVPTLTAKAP